MVFVMTIEQIILLETDLKQSIRKYKSIGKTGLIGGKECTWQRLNTEIEETIKCYCKWSEHEEMRRDNTICFLKEYLYGLCHNIKCPYGWGE